MPEAIDLVHIDAHKGRSGSARSMGDKVYRRVAAGAARLIALAIFATAAVGSLAEARERPFDDEAMMEIHRGGLAYERDGDTYAALSMYGQACDMGLAAACTLAGQIEHETASDNKDHIRAARMFATACRAGDDLACTRTGVALGPLSRANSPEPDGLMKLALLAMGEKCRHEGGDQACVDAAQLLGTTEEIGADIAAVRRYAVEACEEEQFAGCISAAMLPGEEPDAAETRARNVLLCNSGWAGGCDALLEPLMTGDAKGEVDQLKQALKAACDDWVGIACANLGLYYTQGPKDAYFPGIGFRYMRSACDLYVAKACFAYGVMHKKGIGGRVDETRAQSLVAHACEIGSPKACATVARIAGETEKGEVAGISTTEALRRACRLGDAPSCVKDM